MPRPIARLALALLPLAPAAAAGDVVKLKSGGEVRGVIVEADPAGSVGSGEAVTVETPSGGRITLPRADVEFVTARPRLVEEYEVKAKAAPDTVAGLWALAEWCRENRL